MLEKCLITVLELIWNQLLGHRKTKLNICDHMLTSSTQLQNRSFHVIERTRTSSKCQKMKNARAKRAKILFFNFQICKFVGFLLPPSSWLLKLPNNNLIALPSIADKVTISFFASFKTDNKSSKRLEGRKFSIKHMAES